MILDFEKITIEPKNTVTINTEYGDVEVKTFLSTSEKLDLIADIVNASIDDNNYYNPCRIEIMKTVKMMLKYSDIELDSALLEDSDIIFKIYDLCRTGWLKPVFDAIPTDDATQIGYTIYDVIDSVYKYKNSARGIIDSLNGDYSKLAETAEAIKSNVQDPETLGFLKEVLDKLG